MRYHRIHLEDLPKEAQEYVNEIEQLLPDHHGLNNLRETSSSVNP